MLEGAVSIPGCCGIVTVALEISGAFTLSLKDAEKLGLLKTKLTPHVILDNREKNIILDGVQVWLVPHPWNKRKTYS